LKKKEGSFVRRDAVLILPADAVTLDAR